MPDWVWEQLFRKRWEKVAEVIIGNEGYIATPPKGWLGDADPSNSQNAGSPKALDGAACDKKLAGLFGGSGTVVGVAWIRVDARLVNDTKGWQVTELRTGKNDWANLAAISVAVNEMKRAHPLTELAAIAKALESFRKDRGSYVVSDSQAVAIDHLTPRYLAHVIREGPWHQPYKYLGERDRFTLRSAGPDGKEKTADDISVTETSKRGS